MQGKCIVKSLAQVNAHEEQAVALIIAVVALWLVGRMWNLYVQATFQPRPIIITATIHMMSTVCLVVCVYIESLILTSTLQNIISILQKRKWSMERLKDLPRYIGLKVAEGRVEARSLWYPARSSTMWPVSLTRETRPQGSCLHNWHYCGYFLVSKWKVLGNLEI